jgi:pimeloyl-ACP methyl ester carboxylesterase
VARCEALHSLVSGSEYHAIPGAPHNVYYEAAGAYNGIVDAFLAKVAQPAAAR